MPTARANDTPAPLGASTLADAKRLPGEGALWISCKAYRAHQHHHQRDRETGRWRCAICEPYPGVVLP
jgi:hypothetical protein